MTTGIFNLLANPGTAGNRAITDVLDEMSAYVSILNFAFVALCLLLVSLYAITLGFKFARAQDDASRKNAKNQLIYALLGICSISVIMALLEIAIPAITPGVESVPTNITRLGDDVAASYTAVRYIVLMIFRTATTLSLMYAIFVAWSFMKAEDAAKQKNAKQQFLFAVIGIVVAMMVYTFAGAVLQH